MVVAIRIDYELCISCKECVKACSYGVLEWLDDMPIVVNPTACKACSECKLNCPVNALNVEEK